MTSEESSRESADALPVAECLDDLVASLRSSIPVVLKAPPGAGKTTGVPPALLDAGIADQGQILLVQPRRVAARAAARRLAVLRGTSLGEEIGYHVRFDRCVGPQTRLVAMTTGILLRRLSADPLLEKVGCVLLDEFHERSVEMDMVLGMLQRIRATLRPELKLVIMSATLQPGPLVRFLEDAVSLESKGRSYPVEVEHVEEVTRDPIEDQIAARLPNVLKRSSGDVLVFLPGVGEIRRVRAALTRCGFAAQVDLMELYGDMSPSDQDAVLEADGGRKVILATNVAETSITLPGVGAVIDSGTARVMRYEAGIGLPKLLLEPISQASADQRAGRAGRTRNGLCCRLWPRAVHRSRRSTDQPEIERCDLSHAVLTLASWGEREVLSFPWLTPPNEDAVRAAVTLLQRLDAIGTDRRLTPLGRLMMQLPLPPRLARLMIAANHLGVEQEASIAAAMLSERDPFRGGASLGANLISGCDLSDRVERFQRYKGGDHAAVSNRDAARGIARVAAQILRETRSLSVTPEDCNLWCEADEVDPADRLKHALLAAFPDRLTRRRTPDSDRGIMVGGRGVRLHSDSRARSGEFFLAIDVDSKGSEALVRMASQIDVRWLDPRHIETTDEPFFDDHLASVIARRKRSFLDLTLSESPLRCEPSPNVAALLASEARKNMSRVLPRKPKPLLDFIHRVRFLNRMMPQLGLPPLDDSAMDEILVTFSQTRTSFDDLTSAPWLDHARSRYVYEEQKTIDQHAPAHLIVPSGNSIPIRYTDGKPPCMEVRIQEVFGWHETPRIAGGGVAIQLHLLGPNHRPQQITDDLASFWKETYNHVRKELRRRYPKHDWPEDPMSAVATRNGLKPRSLKPRS